MNLTTANKTVGGIKRLGRKQKTKIMKVKLKDESERISFNGRSADITKETLTMERYEWVKQNHPSLVSRFELIEETVTESKPKKAE